MTDEGNDVEGTDSGLVETEPEIVPDEPTPEDEPVEPEEPEG